MNSKLPTQSSSGSARAWHLAAILLASTACTRGLDVIQDPPNAVVVTTAGAWASMIYLARSDSGIIAIDLGWTGAEAALERGTRRLDATPGDVRFAFITHAHRDHIGGWPTVRTASFVLGLAEVPYFAGAAQYQGIVPSSAERVSVTERPTAGEVTLIPVSRDTAFALGSDTVWAFLTPGHTPGSVAYLFRGILFGGDAVNYRPLAGFQGARPEMSANVGQSRASMLSLFQRLDSTRVHMICSAHAKCAENSEALRRSLLK
ncbi:MAG: MBL fold metallo-hydrolase [Gemmatimonadaceae bacterium]